MFPAVVYTYVSLCARYRWQVPCYTQQYVKTVCVKCTHNTYTHCHDVMLCENSVLQIYNDSRALCNTLWGPSFEYSAELSTSPTRMCLVPWFNETESNPNEAAVRRIFGVSNGATSTSGFTYLLAVTALTIFSVLSTVM